MVPVDHEPEEGNGLRLLAHHDLNGFGNGGEGMALQVAPDGRRILYIAHESSPMDWTAVDVSDPASPAVVLQTRLQHRQMRSNSLALVDDLLLVAYQTAKPGMGPAGRARPGPYLAPGLILYDWALSCRAMASLQNG